MNEHGEEFPLWTVVVFENWFTDEGSEGVLNLELLLCYILFDLDDGLIEENALINYTAEVIFSFFVFRRRYLPYEQRDDGSDSSQSSLSELCFSTARNVERAADSTHVPLPLHVKLHDSSQY